MIRLNYNNRNRLNIDKVCECDECYIDDEDECDICNTITLKDEGEYLINNLKEYKNIYEALGIKTIIEDSNKSDIIDLELKQVKELLYEYVGKGLTYYIPDLKSVLRYKKLVSFVSKFKKKYKYILNKYIKILKKRGGGDLYNVIISINDKYKYSLNSIVNTKDKVIINKNIIEIPYDNSYMSLSLGYQYYRNRNTLAELSVLSFESIYSPILSEKDKKLLDKAREELETIYDIINDFVYSKIKVTILSLDHITKDKILKIKIKALKEIYKVSQ